MKKILLVLILIVVSFLAGCHINNYAEDNLSMNIAYYSYYQRVETLLDSIATHDESFMDTEGETDEYCNYLSAKQHLDSVRTSISKREAQ